MLENLENLGSSQGVDGHGMIVVTNEWLAIACTNFDLDWKVVPEDHYIFMRGALTIAGEAMDCHRIDNTASEFVYDKFRQ